MLDCCGRRIHYLRLSVTDRCNLRCVYCMPQQGVKWVEHSAVLTYEQMLRLVHLFARLGIDTVRLTGGEPLVRRGLPTLVSGLKAIPGIEMVSITTNGLLLSEALPQLLAGGLTGVNLSLDTLDRGQYAAIAGQDALDQALTGLESALAIPGLSVKLNCVPMGSNDDQLVPLAGLAQNRDLSVRFIELMPIGLGAGLPRRTEREVLSRLEHAFGPAQPFSDVEGAGPGHYVTFPGFAGRVGFISAMTHQFCGTCNRVRLTSTGFLKACLQYETGVDLKALLDAGVSDDALLSAMEQAILSKPLCHHFSSAPTRWDEGRNMNEIGG